MDEPRRNPPLSVIAAGLAVIFLIVIGLAFLNRPTEDERTVYLSTDVMLPTIVQDQKLTLDEAAYDDEDPEAGHVIAFTPPIGAFTNKCGREFALNAGCSEATPTPTDGEASRSEFIMRVVAGPGDEIAVERGGAVLNGDRADEPFIKPCPGKVGCELPNPVTVPDGHVYVLGDNRAAAKDSRYWGPVPVEAVLGRVDAG